jgi:uncharacterized protein (DUF302 family)
MLLVKNVLAVIGFLSLVLLFLLIMKIYPGYSQLQEFDPHAKRLYLDMAKRTLDNYSGVKAMLLKERVKEGLTADEVDESVRYIANELNIKNVGELPLYKEVESMSGTKFRYIKIYLLCNAMTAASLLNYSDAFSIFLPCRITLLEDKMGQLWLYTMDMDLMIYGGRPLPPALKAEATKVKDIMAEIMTRAAKGDF